MSTKIRNLSIVLLIFMLTCSACKHEEVSLLVESENFRTASAYINNNYELRFFAALIRKAELAKEIDAMEAKTIFAPSDEAFKKYGIQSVNDISKMTKEQAQKWVKDHLFSTIITSSPKDMPRGNNSIQFRNINNGTLFISMDKSNPQYPNQEQCIFNGIIQVRNKLDFSVINGIVHIIEFPLQFGDGNLQVYLSQEKRYSLFVQALKKFKLWDRLSGTDAMTVFPISNEEMLKAGFSEENLNGLNPDDYKSFLFGAYILPGHINSNIVYMEMPTFLVLKSNMDENLFSLFPTKEEDTKIGMGNFGYEGQIGIFIYNSYEKGVPSLKVSKVMRYDLPYKQVECNNGVAYELNNVLVSLEEAKK